MSNHIVTKSWINSQIDTREGAALDHFIGRALVVLMEAQTEDEKADATTKHHNKRGFAAQDGKSGTLTAFYWLKHKRLEDWMVEKWTRPNRLAKYWRQLDARAQMRARA